MDCPLFSFALFLRALSWKEPLGPRDVGAFLEARTQRTLRPGNAIHQPVPGLVRHGLIASDGVRAPVRGGANVKLYRRTDLGARVAEACATSVRAVYAPSAGQVARAPADLSSFWPLTSGAVTLEVLRSANMSATAIAKLYGAKLGGPGTEAFIAGCRTLRRAGLIEPLFVAEREIIYNITMAGQKRADRYRKLVLALYAADDASEAEEAAPVTERDPFSWFMEAAESAPAPGEAWGWYAHPGGRRPPLP